MPCAAAKVTTTHDIRIPSFPEICEIPPGPAGLGPELPGFCALRFPCPSGRGRDGRIPPIEVYFSPHNGATAAIVREIDRAHSEILVQAYSFTSAPIAESLLKAHKRGVKVEVILDKSQKTQKYSSSTFFANARIPTYIDADHAIAHSKIILIDRSVVITGSFNFTRAAEEKNARTF